MTEIRAKHIGANFGKIIPTRLLPGTDLINGLIKVCEKNNIKQGAILMGIGSIRKLTYQVLVPNNKTKLGVAYNEPQIITGPVEVLGIQGVILKAEKDELFIHLHGTFCDKDGKVYAGHLVQGGNPILATLDAVISEITGANLMLRHDEETGLNLF